MAENVAALEYKTQEEVLTVIKHLTAVLSTSGMQLVEHISPGHLLKQLRGRGPEQPPPNVPQEVVSPAIHMFSQANIWF